jgi:CRISPR/Cas system-associated exonuclease Cas4 (RecB family)
MQSSPTANILSHSFSSLKQYETCPRRYYYQRVSKEVKDAPGEASIYGERVHKHIEERLGPERKPLPPEVSKHEQICLEVERAAGGCEIMVEKELVLTQELIPTTWFAPDAYIRTKIDMLATKKDRALVVDWKTGTRRPDFFQMELYALQVFIHYEDVSFVTGAFVWLRDEKVDKEVYSREDVPGLLKNITDRIERIEHSLDVGVWPAKPSGLCRYCPAQTICEFAKR